MVQILIAIITMESGVEMPKVTIIKARARRESVATVVGEVEVGASMVPVTPCPTMWSMTLTIKAVMTILQSSQKRKRKTTMLPKVQIRT